MKKLNPQEIQLAIQFTERLADAELWIRMADDLIAASRILECDVVRYWSEVGIQDGRIIKIPKRKNVQGAYFLLTAYGLENYLKAILICKNQESFKNRLLTGIPTYIKQHDLLKLSREAGLSVSVVDEDILCRLSRNSTWAARYPVPAGPGAINALRQFSDGRTYLVAYFGPSDIDHIHTFTVRLRRMAKRKNRLLHNKGMQPIA